MHYRTNRFSSGFTSEADGPGFFLAADGKTRPRSEMVATLAAFFSSVKLKPHGMTPQCTFPARLAWLREALEITLDELPLERCDRYEAWRDAADPISVSLIFSSYFLNNPASMFGHTLLRFNKRGRTDSERLLDYAVNYAASVDLAKEPAVVYIFKGLIGGYLGYFSAMPYHLKVKEYNDLESRDLWEYELNLDERQAQFVLMHEWELESTAFDYYFFDENCSYHLLSLIEVARPELRLTDQFTVWTLPSDTVRVVAEQPGLVSRVVYRPSRASRMRQKLALLSSQEKTAVADLISRRVDPGGEEIAGFDTLRRAIVLDAAVDMLQTRIADQKEPTPADRAALRAMLLTRSRLGTPYNPDSLPPQGTPPDSGHASSRVTLAAGADGTGARIVEASGYLSFHDLLSGDDGYAPNSQILLGHLKLRWPDTNVQPQVERLALMDVVSLYPLSSLVKAPSWKIGLGWQRVRDPACNGCLPFFLTIGIGVTGQWDAWRREVAFVLLEGVAEWDTAMPQGHRAGFGLTAGLLVDLASTWRVGVTASQIEYSAGAAGGVLRWAFQQRVSLGKNWEVRLDWRGEAAYTEALLGVGWFF